MLIARPLLAAAALLVCAAPAVAQDAISPGYWEMTNQILSPFPSQKTESRCIRAEDIAKFMQGPSNRRYACVYPTRRIGEGRIALAGTCTGKDGKTMPISGEGEFTADTLRLDARIEPDLGGGFVVPILARSTAKRLAETCPVEAAP